MIYTYIISHKSYLIAKMSYFSYFTNKKEEVLSEDEDDFNSQVLSEDEDNINSQSKETAEQEFEFGTCLDQSRQLYKQQFSKIFKLLHFTIENRGIISTHVFELYEYYKDNEEAFISPIHIISFIEDDVDKLYIADGQHRIEALRKLYKEGIDKEILYFIHKANNQEEIKDIIKRLNTSQPIKITFNFEKKAELIKKLKSTFSLAFSSNENHNTDKLNEVKLNNKFQELGFFEKINLPVADIFATIIDMNKIIRKSFIERPKKTSVDKKLFDRIASTHQFYSLMNRDYSWVDELYNRLN